MVLAYYGRSYTEGDPRRLLKTRAGGTSPANVLLHLPSPGFNAAFPDATLSYLREQTQAGHPCIVHVWTPPLPHWQDEAIHAVVVTGAAEDSVLVNDPVQVSGPTTIPLDAFMRAWAATGHTAIVITPRE